MKTKISFYLGGVFLFAMVFFLYGGCGPKYPNCETDEHCKEHNEYCVDNKCKECRDDTHCLAKYPDDPCKVCGGEYTCVKTPGCCTSDLDCPGGKCWIKEGETKGRCAECLADGDCPENYQCIAGRCAPVAECTTDADCGPGKKCENGKCVVSECILDNIYFDFDEYAIRSDARATLNKNYECLKQRGQSISIEGHCDERGTDEYNLALGTRRANAAKNYLINLGFSSAQMKTKSFGEERPICYEHNEDCWWKNRRAEFKF